MSAARVVVDADTRLDQVAAALAGAAADGGLERLLAANPGLAAGGSYVIEGTPVQVPETPAPRSVLPSINPWE